MTIGDEAGDLARMYRLTHLLAGGTDSVSFLRTILHEALTSTGACAGHVLLWEREHRTLRSFIAEGQGLRDGVEVSADEAPWGDVMRAGKMVCIAAAEKSAHRSEIAASLLAVPLLARGDVLGVLAVWGASDTWMRVPGSTLLETLAYLAAHALQHAALARDLAQRQAELGTLIDVGQEIAASLDLDEVLRRVVRQAARLMQAKVGSLMLIDEVEQTLRIRATYGASRTYTQRPPLEISTSLVGEVARTGMPMAVLDVREDPQYQLMDMARAEGLCSLLCVPLKTRLRVIGVLSVYTAERRRFREEEVNFLTALATQSSTAIENARLYRTMLDTQGRLRQSERLAALGSMAVGIAHEIRNPLHTIQLLVFAMQQDYPPPSPLCRDFEVIQNEVARLALLVDQCLDVARPRPPEVRLEKIEEIMEETLLLVGVEANRRGIGFRKRWPSSLPRVCVDGAQIKQVFLNVLLNALQAVESGDTINVHLEADAETIAIVVRDHGVGISPEVHAQLFTPFFTTKPGGTGLGLSIANRIIEGHGGRIRVTSQLGEGTTVRIELPLRSGQAHEKDLTGR